ncbi:hypothetical protein [Streptomyces sp. NPDC001137]|uniref:hypothetical protein n=1 Tax=Streptomyces sp. NPDC001137 TaxID=3154378 RepID=UPI0033330904
MGTSLTPEFWRQSALLLVIAMAVTFVLSAALDALVLRAQQRRAARRPSDTGTSVTTGTTGTTTRRPVVRTPVKN